MKKFELLAATAFTLLLATPAMAQDAAPAAPAQTPPAPRAAPVVRKPVVRAAAPKTPDMMEISAIDTIRQINPTTYEIDGKTPTGAPVMIRMNAFVMQDLGRRLGTFGH